MTTKEQVEALLSVCRAVIDTVLEAGQDGMPCGTVYVALMGKGASLAQYQAIEDAVVRTGVVVKRGQRLFPAA